MAGVAVAPPESGRARPVASAASASGGGGETDGGAVGDGAPACHRPAGPARPAGANAVDRADAQPSCGVATVPPPGNGGGSPAGEEEADALLVVRMELSAVNAALAAASVADSGANGGAQGHAAAAAAVAATAAAGAGADVSEPPRRSPDWVAAATLWRASLCSVLAAAANGRAAAAFDADANVAAAAATAAAAAAATVAADAAAARRLHRRLNGEAPPVDNGAAGSGSGGVGAATGAGTSRAHAAAGAARAVVRAPRFIPAAATPAGDKGKQPAGAPSRRSTSEAVAPVAAIQGVRDKGKQPAGAPPRAPSVAAVGAAAAAVSIRSDAGGTPVKCDVCLSPSPAADSVRHACGHKYCTACMTASFVKAVREPDLLPLRCCGKPIDVTLVERLPLTAAAVVAFKAAHEEATAENKMYCPVSTCSAFVNVGRLVPAGAPPPGAHPCPRCATPLCLRCKARAHNPGVSCAAAAAARAAAADGAAERAVRDLAAAAGWQTCPACAAVVELEHGCNHMQCRCGASFCYACGVRWKRCPCPQWDERRLVLAATEEVDRQDRVRGQGRGAPEVAAARGARVAAAADRMREHGHDECAHKWRRLSAGELTTARCERCSYYLPLYGYVCGRRCAVTVCYTCRWHRME